MKIFNVNVYGLMENMVASGYPKNLDIRESKGGAYSFALTSGDYERAEKLGKVRVGSGHDCYLKGIIVQADITAPQYFWLQWGRYHFHDIVSSQSKMHTLLKMDLEKQCNKYVNPVILKELKKEIEHYNTVNSMTAYSKEAVKEQYQRVVSNVPMGLELTARITTNYLQLKTNLYQRRKHKLEEWQIFCDWIEQLPWFKQLIMGVKG